MWIWNVMMKELEFDCGFWIGFEYVDENLNVGKLSKKEAISEQ